MTQMDLQQNKTKQNKNQNKFPTSPIFYRKRHSKRDPSTFWQSEWRAESWAKWWSEWCRSFVRDSFPNWDRRTVSSFRCSSWTSPGSATTWESWRFDRKPSNRSVSPGRKRDREGTSKIKSDLSIWLELWKTIEKCPKNDFLHRN